MTASVPVVGVLVAMAAATAFEFSYALQALEARLVGGLPRPSAGLLVRLFQRPVFLLAIALALAGYGLQVVALGLAPLTVVQPVLALGLVLLLFLGARVFGERIGRRELAGVAVVIAGVTAIALASPDRVATPKLGPPLVVALLALVLLTALPPALARIVRVGGVALAVGAGAADALAALAAKLISDQLAAGLPLAALGWAAMAGVAVLVGLASELAAVQQLPVARVAPLVLAMQVAVPVALAPAVAGEDWGSTPAGGAVLVAALGAVTAGAALLGSSGPVGALLGGGGGGAGQSQHE